VAPRALIDWGVATLALPGEVESGDLFTVRPTERGVLVGAVDGLGHGADAATAARRAVAELERRAGESVLQLVQSCHQALVGTRGVVMSLAFFDRIDRSLTWLGVGNVEGVLLYTDRAARPPRTTLITPGGIVGSELPRLQAQVISITPGDTLIFASDGIKSGFADDAPLDAAPQQLADQILARYGRGTDDALVLVARYLGDGGGSG
jgi:phosphoserine phosphatase RsbX